MAVSGPSAEITDGRLRVTDPGEGVTLSFGGTFNSETSPADTERFYVPIETAVRLQSSELRIPKLVDLVIMTTEGEAIAEAVNKQRVTVPDGQHLIQITSIGVVCYLRVNGPVETFVADGERVLSFTDETIEVGLRSRHEYPKATVRTTDRPRDIMRAISCFGSALQTTSPERSWPTLRGCPPFIDTGADEFEAPAGLERTETPVHIEVPPELQYIYPVASLAMYLDAQVVPGPDPVLVADGVEHDLGGAGRFERTVQRTLEQLFFFDCVARTDGLYLLNLHERSVVDERSELDLTALYDRSLPEQVNAYLSEPWSLIEDIVPTWKLTADVAPRPVHAGYLPFAANDLAHIRVPTDCVERSGDTADENLAGVIADFERTNPIETPTEFQPTDAAQPPIVTTSAVESIEHAWVGEGVPIGASKPTIEACRRQLNPIGEGLVSVQVIVNDASMRDERVVSELYGLRDLIEMEVSIDEGCTIAETRSLLETEADFVHYIGHVTDAGLQCSDGYLDARTLDEAGMRAFVLNGCRSYQQGRALVECGAIGGVVTLSNVTNVPATVVGQQIAQLLNAGFSLSAALEVIGRETVTGRQYVIVGDGNAALTAPRSGGAFRLKLNSTDSGYMLSYYSYPVTGWGLGATATPNIGDNTQQYLTGGHVATFSATKSETRDLFDTNVRLPVTVDGTLHWSNEIDVDTVVD
ncbi:hypothetical protein [Halomarina rubra]|uniref:CHAT domain-containing protein n=1 Tax=Halomarina rubra TaxID=2071873 RepID=A0ABD6ARQ7_9EURY|nr:hypothetical protein [Halomarina rubra]